MVTLMERNNIKHMAIAAYRYYARSKSKYPESIEDTVIIAAAASAIRHLKIAHKDIAVDVIRIVCYDLPDGDLPRGTITKRVMTAADELNTSYSAAWRELRRACYIFDCYYAEFTPKS